jgi:hypothetical protein
VDHKGSIRHIDDVDPFDPLQPVNHRLPHWDIGYTDDNVADNAVLLKSDDIDGADIPSSFTDGGGDLTQHPWIIENFHSNKDAITCTGCSDHWIGPLCFNFPLSHHLPGLTRF